MNVEDVVRRLRNPSYTHKGVMIDPDDLDEAARLLELREREWLDELTEHWRRTALRNAAWNASMFVLLVVAIGLLVWRW